MLAQIHTCVDAMKSKDSDDNAKALDKINREKAAEAFKQVTLETSEQRAELTADQKKKQEEMKVLESAKNVPMPV